MTAENRATDVKLGLFTMGAIVILVGGSFWVAGSSFLRGHQVRYQVLMESAGGMKAGDKVRLAGVEVGTVEGVGLEPDGEWPVIAVVALSSGITLHEDSSARLASSGVLGASYLEIQPGSPGAAPLPPGGEIEAAKAFSLDEAMMRMDDLARQSLVLLDEMSGILARVSARVDPILARVEDMMSKENTRHINGILEELHVTLDETGPRIDMLLDQLNTIAARASEGTEELPELLDQVSVILEDIQTVLGPEGERLAGMMDAAENSLEGAGVLVDVFSANRGEIDSTLKNLADTAANLSQLSQTLKERPYSLVRIKPPPEREPGDGVEGSR